MPFRTTADLVAGVVQVDDDADLTPFIQAANELVTELCAPIKKAGGSPFYSTLRLQLIETWLAAHFYAAWDQPVTFESISTIQSSYWAKPGLGLDETFPGQQVKRLDTALALASLDNLANKTTRTRIRITYLGKCTP
jgi:hypothetical protein